MANGKYGSWGAGSRSTSSGGKQARPSPARTARGQGIAVGPVTRASTAGGVNSGGVVQRVGGEDRWNGMRGGNRVVGVSGENRWGRDF